jgi:hypothetical protein
MGTLHDVAAAFARALARAGTGDRRRRPLSPGARPPTVRAGTIGFLASGGTTDRQSPSRNRLAIRRLPRGLPASARARGCFVSRGAVRCAAVLPGPVHVAPDEHQRKRDRNRRERVPLVRHDLAGRPVLAGVGAGWSPRGSGSKCDSIGCLDNGNVTGREAMPGVRQRRGVAAGARRGRRRRR